MSVRVSTEELRSRKVLTPTECARVFGRGASYWRERLDLGEVEGYRDALRADGRGRQVRRILVESVEAFLKYQAGQHRATVFRVGYRRMRDIPAGA